MGNCLKTQLKESVQSENLKKLGILEITRVSNSNDSQNKSKLELSGNGNATIKGDGYFMSSYGGQSIGKTIQLTSSTTRVYTSNGDYTIEVENKYECDINNAGEDNTVNVGDLFYTNTNTLTGEGHIGNISEANPNKIKEIELTNTVGTTEDYGKFVNLEYIYIFSNNISGDIKNLGHLIKLSTSSIHAISGVSGKIEEFVSIQRADGITERSTPLKFAWLNGSGRLSLGKENGSPFIIPNRAYNELIWTASTITLRNGSSAGNITFERTIDNNGDIVS